MFLCHVPEVSWAGSWPSAICEASQMGSIQDPLDRKSPILLLPRLSLLPKQALL